nr:hypothetical protein CFP56_14987 [Quercus suber]
MHLFIVSEAIFRNGMNDQRFFIFILAVVAFHKARNKLLQVITGESSSPPPICRNINPLTFPASLSFLQMGAHITINRTSFNSSVHINESPSLDHHHQQFPRYRHKSRPSRTVPRTA